jgi:Thiamine pyrophosphate-requiring enzymes [acetolactate synthase, pyruvate dehydrogenase (cytochrome), glyoxylate carboligase, phosphonopyruvate decarboxylase]
MPILYSCRDTGIEVIDFRHECAATYAADAYARVTGKPAVLTTTAGPGVTNTVSGMAEALYQGSPIIHIGGASPSASNDTGDEQDVNTLEIMSTVSKWARKIHYVQRIPEYVAMAFRHAMDARPGPVYLEIGLDVLCERVNEDEVEYPENYRTQAEPFGDPMLVERAADMLIASQRPLIIVGDGVRFNAQHGEAIAALAEHLKIPVSVQTVCRGLFADEEKNPLFRFARAESRADLVLMLDVENNFMVINVGPLSSSKRRLLFRSAQ